ncbi:T9SS type A sorting domain-containing protein [candidate division WOR-3 bacterium]|nr:T9SS type A sorting domain-containing protein [candidate division WOR-3 bacterium]
MRYVWVVLAVVGIMVSTTAGVEQPILMMRDISEGAEIVAPQYSGYESIGGKGVLEDTLHYDGAPAYVLVWSGDITFEGAIRLTPTELAGYDGWQLKSVLFYHVLGTHSCNAKIYDDGTSSAPGPLMTQEPYTAVDGGWKRIDLSSPVRIDASKDLWVSVEISVLAGDNTLTVDAGPATIGKGDFMYDPFNLWTELWMWGIDCDWNIRAVVIEQFTSDTLHPGWNLIAVPVVPDDPDPDVCFGDDIPVVNIYDFDEYTKSYNNPTDLVVGKGYMLQSSWNNAVLDITGTSVTLPYTITGLTRSYTTSHYGWNLAGNPTTDTIDFDNLTLDNVNFLYKYFDGYGYKFYPGGGMTNLIPDWRGFWVQVNNPGTGSFTVNSTVKGKAEPIDWDWRLKLSATSGELIDEHNYIGVSSDERVMDVVEFVVPLSEYVLLYFEDGEAGYQQLVLDGEEESYSIPFDVEVNTSNSEVTLSWEFEGYPEGMRVYLVDGDNEIDMKENSSYTFQNSFEGGDDAEPIPGDPVLLLSRKASGEICYFTIKVEPLLGIEDIEVGYQTRISDIYPNPLTKDANIRFTLSNRTDVSLGVYDVGGRLIETLVDGVRDAGEHSVIWDGSNLPTGIYFIKLTAGDYSEMSKAVILR